MFGVPVQGMDPMVRRRAKAINFGIIYGISAFGLAAPARHPARTRRARYIDAYFERFPGIRDYMDRTKAEARADTATSPRSSAGAATCAAINDKNPARARLRRARRDQRADPGLGRRHHQARHDPHAARARGRGPGARDCCCRSTTNCVFEVPDEMVEPTAARRGAR